MKTPKLIILIIFIFNLSATLAQTQTSDPPGKLPGPDDGDHVVSIGEFQSYLGEALYLADKKCTKKGDEKLESKDFLKSYETLLIILEQRHNRSLQPDLRCEHNCSEKVDKKLDKYLRCLLRKGSVLDLTKKLSERMAESILTGTEKEIYKFLKEFAALAEDSSK